MATYNHLISYLLQIERETAIFLILKKIGFWIFAIMLIVLFFALFQNVHSIGIPFFSGIKKILGLLGITGSTLASSLYAQLMADELSKRRINLLNRMRWFGSKEIPNSFYENLLYDSFKDALK